MKIIIDGRMITWTGIGRYTSELIANLAATDHENQYIILLQQHDFDTWTPPAGNFEKIPVDIVPYSVAEQRQLGSIVKRLQPDLVHFPHFTVPQGYNLPFVVTIHDLTLIDYSTNRSTGPLQKLRYAAKQQAMKVVLKHAIAKSTAIITPTNYVKQQLIERFGVAESKVTVTYEAGELTTTKAVPYEQIGDHKLILYVGNAYPYKNLERLVEAFGLLGNPDYKLVLVGKRDYFYEQLEALVTKKQIKNVVFTGYATDGELAWLYQQATAYAFPSLSEGFGLPGLEAMAYGLPVVSSNATCLPEVYGEAAHYFDPLDTRDMAAKLAEVLDDDQLRGRLVKAGTARLKDFSWERMAKQTLEVYTAAVGSGDNASVIDK